MKKTLVLLAICCLFFSCKDKKKDTTDKDKVTTTDTKKDPPKEKEIDDSLDLPDDIFIYLEEKMPGQTIVSKEEWLSEDYLKDHPYLRYNEDIFAEGDFNGDGESDFATFLKDEKGNVNLYAFHKTGDGFKKYLLQKEGKPEYLGAGLDVEPPGFVYGGNKEVGLEYNGINYNIYEKTGTTFYYNAGRYRKVLTSD